MNSAPLGSIRDCVECDGPLLGRQHALLGLASLVELNQLLGSRLAKQVGQGLAVFFRDLNDRRLLVRLFYAGSRGLAVNRGLLSGC